eukprot:1181721-Prorocentrum_minimum.AAC.5
MEPQSQPNVPRMAHRLEDDEAFARALQRTEICGLRPRQQPSSSQEKPHVSLSITVLHNALDESIAVWGAGGVADGAGVVPTEEKSENPRQNPKVSRNTTRPTCINWPQEGLPPCKPAHSPLPRTAYCLAVTV